MLVCLVERRLYWEDQGGKETFVYGFKLFLMPWGISVKLLQDRAHQGRFAVQHASMVSCADFMRAVLEGFARGTVPDRSEHLKMRVA